MTAPLLTSSVIRITVALFLPAWLLAPAIGTAADQVDTSGAEGETSPFSSFDKHQELISQKIVSLSASMDSFFADEIVFAESRKSYIRVFGDLTYAESRASDFSIRVQAKLVLPALEHRLKLVLESDDPTVDNNPETSTISTPKGVPDVDVPKDFRAAVQVLVTDSPKWNINTDAGIRIHSFLPDPFVRLRARRSESVGNWQLRLIPSAYWFEQTGMGATMQFDADRKLNDDHLGRSRTIATWSDHDQQYYYEQDFSLFQRIDDSNAMSYNIGIFGESKPNTHVTDYALSVKWRHRLHREWLFVEVQPVLEWPEGENFHATTSILLRLEAVFGDVSCNCYGM